MFNTFNDKLFLIIIGTLLFGASACNKKDNDNPAPDTTPGALVLTFKHKAGANNFNFDADYTNALGQQLRFTMFNYFISNVKMVKADGSLHIFNQDSSYFCIRHVSGQSTYEASLKDLPVGKYTHVEFTIGIDSLRSASDISKRQGVLDPAAGAQGMYWAWNSGYVFVKCEGTSPQAPEDATGSRRFRYHIGGFGGYSSPTINNIKTIRLPLSNTVELKGRQKLEIELNVDVLKIFNGTTNLSVATHPTVMFNPFSVNIANNYVNMFSVDHAHVK